MATKGLKSQHFHCKQAKICTGLMKNVLVAIHGLIIPICFSQILRITFPFFDLENSASCSFDFLQVNDGDSASSYMIGKYCGTAAPAELFSSHNSLYFWFRSDHSVSRRGFTVAWTSQAPGKSRTSSND